MNGPILLPEELGDGDEKSAGSSRRLSVAPDETKLRAAEEARTLKGVAPNGGTHGYWSTDKGHPTLKQVLKHPDDSSGNTVPYMGNATGTVVSLSEALAIRARKAARLGTEAMSIKPKTTFKDSFGELNDMERSDIQDLFDERNNEESYAFLLSNHLNNGRHALRLRGIMEKFLSEGTAVNVMESEADEWDPAAKGKTYLITSYEVQNPKKELKGGARATADVTVYIESEDKKEHMAISLRDLFRWNSIE